MVAFVPNAGLNAVTRGTLPGTGLQSACGQTVSTVTAAPRSSSSAVRMLITPVDQSITLQTLTYEPNPAISGVEDKDLMCYRVWRQVFGNAYVMHSERQDAYNAESNYRAGMIPLREFVRAVALTDTYRRRFFECCGPYRAVELNFRHLLGRAPMSQAEASKHVQIIAKEGFEAEINSYIDSVEYEEAFGDDYIPYMRFKGTYATIEEFNRMCTIMSAPGTSDKSLTMRARNIGVENPNNVLSLDGAGHSSRLVSVLAMDGKSSFVSVKRALPMRPDLEHGQESSAGLINTTPPKNPAANPKRRVEVSMGNYMYLSKEEEATMASEQYQANTVLSFARGEIAEAEKQIAALQAKVVQLKSIA